MRHGLLFDNNLSPRLPSLLAAQFPGAVHVQQLGLAEADDQVVWEYARVHGFTIVTKDDDFRQLAFVHGAPPQVIWVHLGNCSTADIALVLSVREPAIRAFLADTAASLLILNRSS